MDLKRYLGEDFNEFIRELIDNKRLNDSAEEGISKLVIDRGFDFLSDKQKFVFLNKQEDQHRGIN